jgi:hypothetical protein
VRIAEATAEAAEQQVQAARRVAETAQQQLKDADQALRCVCEIAPAEIAGLASRCC